jgi:dipeptidyl aminopeptidase/acylaminoacyl peptidase
VDALVRQGIADPDRLGISGISYGGYLTARAVTQTTRFKAAVMASGISNWFALHTGQTTAPESAARLEWDRSPFDAAALLWDRSPSAHVRDVKTPTLLLWGEHDSIPVSQASTPARAT